MATYAVYQVKSTTRADAGNSAVLTKENPEPPPPTQEQGIGPMSDAYLDDLKAAGLAGKDVTVTTDEAGTVTAVTIHY